MRLSANQLNPRLIQQNIRPAIVFYRIFSVWNTSWCDWSVIMCIDSFKNRSLCVSHTCRWWAFFVLYISLCVGIDLSTLLLSYICKSLLHVKKKPLFQMISSYSYVKKYMKQIKSFQTNRPLIIPTIGEIEGSGHRAHNFCLARGTFFVFLFHFCRCLILKKPAYIVKT